LIHDGPQPADGIFRLASEVPNQQNAIAFDRTAGTPGPVIVAEFDFRISNQADDSADGLAFLLLSTELHGDSGPLKQFVGEEPNLSGAFGVGFDTFDNDEEDCPALCLDRRANHVSLHWDGQQVGDIQRLDRRRLDLVNGTWNHASIRLEQVARGAEVTVTIKDGSDGSEHVAFNHEFLPRVSFLAGLRAAFTARTGGAFDLHDFDNVTVSYFMATPLQAGDADQDYDFDQLDLIQVSIADKYLTGEPATWGEGDWNGAPGGWSGNPPEGDGVFDQFDVLQALKAGLYLTGEYGAIQRGGQAGDSQTSIRYDARTGQLAVDAPAGTELTSINIDSAAGIFTGAAAQNLGGSFDNDQDNNLFKATFGSSFGSLSFGNVAQAGLAEQFLLGDLTVVGSLQGGGALGDVDLIYIPEPPALWLTLLATFGLVAWYRHHHQS
jgi:hypothetical protein